MAKPVFNRKSPTERAKLRKFADLKAGITYVVTREVVNPHGDRRAKGDWRRAGSVPAGTRLYAVLVNGEICLEPFERDVPVMPGAQTEDDEKAVDLYYELLLALEEAQPRTIDLLRASTHGISGHDVLVCLGREKLIEPAAIREALSLILAAKDNVEETLVAISEGVSDEQLLEALVAMETIAVDDVKLAMTQIGEEIEAANAKALEEAQKAEEATKANPPATTTDNASTGSPPAAGNQQSVGRRQRAAQTPASA